MALFPSLKNTTSFIIINFPERRHVLMSERGVEIAVGPKWLDPSLHLYGWTFKNTNRECEYVQDANTTFGLFVLIKTNT